MRPPDALAELAGRFDPEAFDVPEGECRLALEVRGVGRWDALIGEDGRVRVEPGPPERKPEATISADRETWEAVARDVAGGLDAYRRGALAVRRNLHLAVGFLAATNGATEPGRLRFRTIRTPQARFSILEAGIGDPLVMLHGLGGTKISFLPVVAELAPKGYRTVAVDLPGFGDSGKPLGAAYDPPFFARSIVALLDELGIGRAHVVGHSLGGRVALEVGMEHAERAASLILMTPSLAWLAERPWTTLVRALRPELGALQLAPRPIVEGIVRRMIPGSDNPWVAAGIDEFLRAYLTPRGRAAFYASLRNIYLEDPDAFWRALRRLGPPALFIWGRHDGLVPIAFERHVREAVPGARHVELSSGHVPQLEVPKETNRAIAAFLAERPPIGVAEAV